MKSIRNKNFNLFLNFLFPSKCLICERPLNYTNLICPDCQRQILPEKSKKCKKCGTPLSDNYQSDMCINCRNKYFPYNELKTLFFYQDKIKILIKNYKFRNRWRLSFFFAKYIIDYINIDFLNVDYFIPIPLSKKRFKERGYNQTELIVEILSKFFKIPYLNIIKKIKNTKPQSLLSREERINNLKNTFSIFNKNHTIIYGKNILVFDDVVTTGSTIFEICKLLKKEGATKINVLTLAKSV